MPVMKRPVLSMAASGPRPESRGRPAERLPVDGVELLALVDRVYVINLPERSDRRRDLTRRLVRGWGAQLVAERVEFFSAVRPSDPGGFASAGYRGCFESHQAVLDDALARGFERILVLEDDADLGPDARARLAPLLPTLALGAFHVAQLGYAGAHPPGHDPKALAQLVRFDGEVLGSHCLVYTRAGMELVRDHLRLLHDGTPGDPLRGPMSPDGALNTLPWVNPEAVRLLCVPSAVGQAASRSDIMPGRWDRIPVAAPGLRVARRLLRSVRGR
jgi:glycosyl transferase, family 25